MTGFRNEASYFVYTEDNIMYFNLTVDAELTDDRYIKYSINITVINPVK